MLTKHTFGTAGCGGADGVGVSGRAANAAGLGDDGGAQRAQG
jgi:hypothetical protein